jgi:hypothetical protein
MRALPADDVRQILWRFSDRFDLQMLVQSARAVARGPVAKLVASGARNTHEWTPDKSALLKAFDEAGITAVYMEPEVLAAAEAGKFRQRVNRAGIRSACVGDYAKRFSAQSAIGSHFTLESGERDAEVAVRPHLAHLRWCESQDSEGAVNAGMSLV